jgi:hypothetical protein
METENGSRGSSNDPRTGGETDKGVWTALERARLPSKVKEVTRQILWKKLPVGEMDGEYRNGRQQ